jgi:hypothetical protein
LRTVDVEIGMFKMTGVEAPDWWSDRAVAIAASKYFAPGEDSIYKMVDRVVMAIADKGSELGYFKDLEAYAQFVNDLRELCLQQRFAFAPAPPASYIHPTASMILSASSLALLFPP